MQAATNTVRKARGRKAKAEGRNDPAPRTFTPFNRFDIHNRDQFPDKWFKWVNAADSNQGIQYHEMYGYKRVPKTVDGPKCICSSEVEPGGFIQQDGNMFLMWMSMERHNEVEAHGPWGNSGQAMGDFVDRALGEDSDLRGVNNKNARGKRVLLPLSGKDSERFGRGQGVDFDDDDEQE